MKKYLLTFFSFIIPLSATIAFMGATQAPQNNKLDLEKFANKDVALEESNQEQKNEFASSSDNFSLQRSTQNIYDEGVNDANYDPISIELKKETTYYFDIEYRPQIRFSYTNPYWFLSQSAGMKMTYLNFYLLTSNNNRIYLSNKHTYGSNLPSTYVSAGPLLSGYGQASTKIRTTGSFYLDKAAFAKYKDEVIAGIAFDLDYRMTSNSGLNIKSTSAFISYYKISVKTNDTTSYKMVASEFPNSIITTKLNSSIIDYKSDYFVNPNSSISMERAQKFWQDFTLEERVINFDAIAMTNEVFEDFARQTSDTRILIFNQLLKENGYRLIDYVIDGSNDFSLVDVIVTDFKKHNVKLKFKTNGLEPKTFSMILHLVDVLED